jgi:predicted HAD superfamily Cof-like phosphohydrolase
MSTTTGPAATSPEQMLRQFHASKAIHGGLMPERPTADIPAWVQSLRMDLLDEEVAELREAVEAGDIVKIADAIGDIAYVVTGTAVAYGIPFDAVLAEVHRSNMTKVNTPAEAKLVKGPDYEPPRIAHVLGLNDAASRMVNEGITGLFWDNLGSGGTA